MSWSLRAPGVFHRSGQGGRTVAIVGSMHGDEPAGAQAVERLLAWPESAWSACPDAVVLATGHPAALARGVRSLQGEPDLNRCFGHDSAAGGERAAVLRAALSDVDVLLDLHQTHRPIPPLAVLPDGGEAAALARRLGLDVAVEGAGVVYGDAMLADWVVRRGGRALTVELGAISDARCVDRAEALARALLFGEAGSVPDGPQAGALRVWRITRVLRAPGPGLRFVRALDNEGAVRAGERLATSDGGDLLAPGDGVVFLPREGVPKGAAAALFAERVS